MYYDGIPVRHMAQIEGVSHETIYKVLRAEGVEMNGPARIRMYHNNKNNTDFIIKYYRSALDAGCSHLDAVKYTSKRFNLTERTIKRMVGL